MIKTTLLCLATLCGAASAQETSTKPASTAAPVVQAVRTTAYTHTESDHVKYGARTAVGTLLRHGDVRSAAADWSVYPVGTVFQIQADPSIYVIDDYGSALVGTRTIDIYKPTTSLMNLWGTRNVNIRILKWGSYTKSLAILMPRAAKASHVREMIGRLRSNAS